MRLPEPGDLFEGRYRLERELGAGGFSRVFLVRDEHANRPAALKVLVPDHGGYSTQTRARFDREVQIIANLTHPNTVTLFDRGRSRDGLLYMVFEHVAGEDLADLLARHGQLDRSAVKAVLAQVLGALAEAHRVGLVHRDIKPQNIRVNSAPGAPLKVRLLDFGIARPTDQGGPSITKTGELIGTPRYMSPEQLIDKPLTPRSDIYSLGMVAFELLVGSDALPGNSLPEQLHRLQTGHLLGTEMIGRIGTELLSIVQRTTARDPQDRFPSAAAVLAALDSESQSFPVPPVSTGQATAPPSNLPIIGGSLIIVVLLSIIVAVLVTRSDPPESPRPTTAKSDGLSALLKNSTPEPTAAEVDASLPASRDVGNFDADVGAIAHGASGCRTSGFRERPHTNAEVLLPRDYDPKTPHPAVVWLMADQDPPLRVPQTEPFQRLVHDEGVVLIVPLGASNGDWRTDQAHTVARIVDQVREQYCIDPDRIFLTSTGGSGLLATHLACEPWVAAVAFSAFLGPAERLRRCAPVLWLTAEDSLHLPIEGGRNCIPIVGHEVEALDKVESAMRHLYGCHGRSRKVPQTDGQCRTWTCEVPFESCLLDGGIGWPGTPQSPVSKNGTYIGCPEPPPSAFDATSHAWQFFKRVSARPDSN